MKRTATERGMPLVVVGESTGARLPDAMGSRGMGQLLGNDPTQFRRTRETPMAAAAFGPSFGSSTWLMCLSDFSVMHKSATMAVSSPRLVSMALGEKVTAEELGGWRLHAEITGLMDQVVDTEEEVFDALSKFLSYMPSHHNEAPPDAPVPAGSGADMDKVFSILPESRTQVYDMKRVIKCVVDKDTMFELKPRFGKSAVTALARLGGKSVGIVANNPLHRGGALDADACRKIVDFLVLCDSFNVPIVILVDTPGFQIGTEAEKAGAPGQDHELHERDDAGHRAASVGDRAQELRPRLRVHGRRAPFRRRRRVADRGNQLHEPGVRDQDRARRRHGRAGFRRSVRRNQAGLRRVGSRVRVCGAGGDPAAEHTRDYLIRMLDVYKLRMTKGVGQHLMRTWPTSY